MTTSLANFGLGLHKSIKKSIAVILLVVMVISMVPLAFAERGDERGRSDVRVNSRIAVRASADDNSDEDGLVDVSVEDETRLRVRGQKKSSDSSRDKAMMPPGQWRKDYFHKRMKEYQEKFEDMYKQCTAQCPIPNTNTAIGIAITDTAITGTSQNECNIQCKETAQDYYTQVRGQIMGEFATYRDQYTESRARSGQSGQEVLWMPPEMMPPEFMAEMMGEDDDETDEEDDAPLRSDMSIKARTKARTRAQIGPAMILPASDEAFERSRGELEEARNNYQLARKHYEEAQQRFAQQKGRLQGLHDDFKVCEKQSKKGDTESSECGET